MVIESPDASLQKKISDFKELTFPANEKWARIFVAFCYIYVVAATVLYSLGFSNFWATKIVYYIWKLNPIGLFWGDVPYSCAPETSMAEHWICSMGFGTEGLDLSHAEFGYTFHWSYFVLIIGGLVSVRILVFFLDSLEKATGIDFLSRVIEKFLPGKRPD
jgi:hypothetical protein